MIGLRGYFTQMPSRAHLETQRSIPKSGDFAIAAAPSLEDR